MRLEIPDGFLLVLWDEGELNSSGEWDVNYHYGYVLEFMKNVTAIVVDVDTARFKQMCLDELRIVEHLPVKK